MRNGVLDPLAARNAGAGGRVAAIRRRAWIDGWVVLLLGAWVANATRDPR